MKNLRNMYYGDPAKFDLSKMKADAYRFSQGDQHNEPRDVVIHHHAYEVPCNYPETTPNTPHEYYPAVFGEEK